MISNKGKERAWAKQHLFGKTEETLFSTTTKSNLGSYSATGVDYLDVSMGNRGPPYRSGGSFRASSCDVHFNVAPESMFFIRSAAQNWTYRHNGNFIPAIQGKGLKGLSYDDTRLLVSGTKGYNRFKPGNSTADLGQMLVELRDLPRLPKVITRVTKGANSLAHMQKRIEKIPSQYDMIDKYYKELGEEYLNVEFGWKPFLRDLQKSVGTAVWVFEALAQLRRDNGKGIRRRGMVDVIETQFVSRTQGAGGFNTPPVLPALATQYYTGGWTSEVVTQQHDEYAFSGRFRYWIPDIGTSAWTQRATLALFGLQPSPKLIWNLLPWSWLLDWVGSSGDAFANLSTNAAENLVADYAFVTGNRKQTVTTTVNFATPSGPKVCSAIITKQSKARDVASPYGFGLTWPNFNARQLAILGSLGITRS